MRFRDCTATLVGVLLVVSTAGIQAVEPTKVVAVECAAGQTIAKALTLGDERKPLRVVLRGVCNEHVVVDRSDVTLVADTPGSGVHGPDPATDVIRVTASRVTIEGLTVTGGRNGVAAHSAAGLTVRNTVVHDTGLNGIVYGFGASGIVDGCTLQNNARDGIVIGDGASATVVNSTLSQNGRAGIIVFGNSAARIGTDNLNAPGGNVISNNGSNGIHVTGGSNATIAMTQITGNGTSPTGALGRFGVSVVQANADLVGNTISNNAGTGVNVRSSAVSFGLIGIPGVSPENTISGNGFGNPATPFGVFGSMGASLFIQSAVITGNRQGLVLFLRSSAQIQNTTVAKNAGDGIRLTFGSGLFPATANSVSDNVGFGLNCTDGESSVVNTALLGLVGNVLGDQAPPGCTGF